ncbi:MAG: hypothetical protein ACR2JK_18260 [Geodermatophilaceae bacterium]
MSADRRSAPPPDMFASLVEQVANIRRWNEDREWDIDEHELAAVDLSPRMHADPLVVDLIAVYLDGSDSYLDGVRRTCHELWSVASERQPHTWSWDWLRGDGYDAPPKPVRLLPGIVHRPGVRRVTLDLGAHWIPGQAARPRRLRGPDSAHAEILAAAAHFPRWARAMNGSTVPFIWLSGYQVTYPEEGTDKRLPGLAWVQYRRTLSLTVDWVDHSHSGWASPVRVG